MKTKTKMRKIDHWAYQRYRNWRYWCYHPRSARYQDMQRQGIEVHGPWLRDFWRFAAWVEKTLGPPQGDYNNLDRIDNSRGYVPGNLKWSTNRENHWNRRDSLMITIGKRTQCLAAWCEERQLIPATVWSRGTDWGWTWEQALEFVPKPRDK